MSNPNSNSKFSVNPAAAGVVCDVTLEKTDLLHADESGIAYRMRIPVGQFAFDSDADKAVVVPKTADGKEASILFADLDIDLAKALVENGLKVCGTATAVFGVDEVKNPATGAVTQYLRCRITPDAVVDLSESAILDLAHRRAERIAAAKAKRAAAEAAGDAAAPAAN